MLQPVGMPFSGFDAARDQRAPGSSRLVFRPLFRPQGAHDAMAALKRALLHLSHARQSEQIKASLASLLLLCASQSQPSGPPAEFRRAMQVATRRPQAALREFGARPLQVAQAPALYAILLGICRRAGLRRMPELYLLPFSGMNAYALGGPENACISVTEGLLRSLSHQEISGIFAHEVAHILHRDDDSMNAAALMQQAIIHLASRPGAHRLAQAPMLARLLTSALSRVRELAADLRATDLIDDPTALTNALCKLEIFHTGRAPARPMSAHPGKALNSHPETWERIAHLC